MVPLYLPLVQEETDQSAGSPLFFGGLSVFLDQKSSLYRNAPAWLHRWVDSPIVLRLVGKAAARTRPEKAGELALSMIRGEEGHQARELRELVAWLKTQPKPDVLCLSNCLLLGLARQIRKELRIPVACLLAGEHSFLDAMDEPFRNQTWSEVSRRIAEIDWIIAPSHYYAELMSRRFGLPRERIHVLPIGMNLEDCPPVDSLPWNPPVLGFFARMCSAKGLDLLVDAYLLIRQRGRVPGLRLKVGGGLGPADEPFVRSLRDRLNSRGLAGEAEFSPNLNREEKLSFLRSLTVFSVPATYGEAFGLYLIEAMACGIPVVQPRLAAFTEIVESSGGGVLCEPDAESLATAIESLLLDPARADALRRAGRKAVEERFEVSRTARELAKLFGETPDSGWARRPDRAEPSPARIREL